MIEGEQSGRASADRMRMDSDASSSRRRMTDEIDRGPGHSRRRRLPRRTAHAATATLAAGAVLAIPQAARAQLQDLSDVADLFKPADILYLALFAIMIGASLLSAVYLIRQRGQISAENDQLRTALAESRAEAEARTLLLTTGDERLLVYAGVGDGGPQIFGALPTDCGAPPVEKRFLAFADWMPSEVARRLENAIGRLRGQGETFRTEIDLDDGRLIEATGTTIGGLAAVRFMVLQGLRSQLREAESAERGAVATLETMQALFDSAPIPVWLRDREGKLTWINTAYAKAVDARSVDSALNHQMEFLAAQDRRTIAARLAEQPMVSERLSTVVEADRRNFSVVEAAGPLGSAGLAIDVTETEQVRMELRQTIDSQSETLDQLTTAVARFDEKTRLTYYNAAFQRLFDLTNAYLETGPDHLSLLDRLRTEGILPTERLARSELQESDLAAYRATEPTLTHWHLSDARTLRVIATPQPRGGATWIFEDITEKLELESQIKATVQLQRETIDYLSEAVAVFASDGRLRLSNPSFADLFGFDADVLAARPRIHTLGDLATVTMSQRAQRSEEARSGQAGIDRWTHFVQAVTDLDEGGRSNETGELMLSTGQTVAYAIVPLPNAQTMITFSDISDAREAERMLIEKNDALEQANRIKNDFVKHVNYELRSPLTNIIGFSALLNEPETGPLNERQSEYLGYIGVSTSALLTIVNDILDLATVDAGIMVLDVADVDIAGTVEHAAEGMRKRFEEAKVSLDIDLAGAGKNFRADGHRLTQILFNLLSNAANFAPAGTTVELKAQRGADHISFAVTDRGPGIAPGKIDRIFERFEADPSGARHSGAGLGLSIVKSFVELHHGTIHIDSTPGVATTVICTFPLTRPGDEPPDGDVAAPKSLDDKHSDGPSEQSEKPNGEKNRPPFEDAAE